MKAYVISLVLLTCSIGGCARSKAVNVPPYPNIDTVFSLIDANNVDAIQELIDKGYDVNTIGDQDIREYSLLIYAIENDRPDIVKLLLDNNVDMELCTIDTALPPPSSLIITRSSPPPIPAQSVLSPLSTPLSGARCITHADTYIPSTVPSSHAPLPPGIL